MTWTTCPGAEWIWKHGTENKLHRKIIWVVTSRHLWAIWELNFWTRSFSRRKNKMALGLRSTWCNNPSPGWGPDTLHGVDVAEETLAAMTGAELNSQVMAAFKLRAESKTKGRPREAFFVGSLFCPLCLGTAPQHRHADCRGQKPTPVLVRRIFITMFLVTDM